MNTLYVEICEPLFVLYTWREAWAESFDLLRPKSGQTPDDLGKLKKNTLFFVVFIIFLLGNGSKIYPVSAIVEGTPIFWLNCQTGCPLGLCNDDNSDEGGAIAL